MLRTAGIAAAAALTLPDLALAQAGGPRAEGQPMPEGVDLPEDPPAAPRGRSLGIAVIGLGDFALKQMLPRFGEARRVHVAGLVSGNPTKLNRVGAAYGVGSASRYSYDNFDRIAQDDAVEAVYIALPSGLHAEWAERAFAAGKHVLTEKPMALSSRECERMIAASRRADRRLMVAYRCHFEPHNRRAMALMDRGVVGHLRTLRTGQAYRTGPATPLTNWRLNRALAGGGPLEDLGIYGLQAALYLSNEMPESIAASTFRPAGDPRFAEVFAHVASQWRFPSGAVAQLATSYDSLGNNFAEAYGDEGALVMNPATNYSDLNLRVEGRNAQVYDEGDATVQFAGELDHFADAVIDGSAIRTPGEMGLRDLRLIEAIYTAAGTGRTVQLNPDGTMRG
ncbi:Gfo/Idh/MocA family protein [Aurantiacibacter spongiae]|nr:Gfo/Idh/MocA family oxidoreductase [Aurantiacibacter spongiae]